MAAVARVHLDIAFAPYRVVKENRGERSLVEDILKRFSLGNALFLLNAGFFRLSF